MHPGELVCLVHESKEAIVMLSRMDGKTLQGTITEIHDVSAEPKRQLTAYVAMFRKEPFEWMLEKLTEIGVSEIVPMDTERTVRFPWKPERYEAILKEAAEQSGRGKIPTLHEPMSFSQALDDANRHAMSMMLDPGATAPCKTDASSVGMFVGPEGGFTPAEVSTAKARGLVSARLGELTLRAETAALVGAYKLLE